MTPGPPNTRTRSFGSITEAAAWAEVITEPEASIPNDPSLASCCAIVENELLVTNTTSCPDARRSPTASADPGMGIVPCQITPSRSSAQVVMAANGSPRKMSRVVSADVEQCW